ncbi:hypothetical protein J7W08_05780 [Methanococcoides orientis]|uniref:hypothetical protein n=1 Tax=Methanococcoides orientis TaxID=2822137 RepID=UPI001E45B332|nr:hypothetical protein [Methanococcoides orientis]UGV41783.1 hypothetical protein J7W08_05780 [Methanococcoides orientis]
MNPKKSYIFRNSIVLLILLSCIGTVSAATITVGDNGQNFTTISDAVFNASSGDTILVSDGIYTENIDVNKALTIISENGSTTTVIQSSVGSAFNVNNINNVTICGFNITGATNSDMAGIKLTSAYDCNISNNNLNGNNFGI